MTTTTDAVRIRTVAATTSLEALSDKQQPQRLCQECHEAPCLYACPRCRFRSCSLKCCLSHKKRTGCNGKRDVTAFLPMAKMTDSTLQSDYHFLENVLNQVQGGKRLVRNLGAHVATSQQFNKNNNKNNQHKKAESTDLKEHHPLLKQEEAKDVASSAMFKIEEEPLPKRQRTSGNNNCATLSPKWRKLVERARERSTTLLLMPAGMERHKVNTSCYIVKQDVLCWRVEFVMHHDDDSDQTTVLTAAKVSERADLNEELRKLQKQQKQVGTAPQSDDPNNSWTMLMKKLPCPSNKALYVELKQQQQQVGEKITLRDALSNMTVIEFPTIHVVMKQHLERYPRIIQEL